MPSQQFLKTNKKKISDSDSEGEEFKKYFGNKAVITKNNVGILEEFCILEIFIKSCFVYKIAYMKRSEIYLLARIFIKKIAKYT